MFQETPAGRKAAHREGKLRMKQEKLQRENACKKVTTVFKPLPMKMHRWPAVNNKLVLVILALTLSALLAQRNLAVAQPLVCF